MRRSQALVDLLGRVLSCDDGSRRFRNVPLTSGTLRQAVHCRFFARPSEQSITLECQIQVLPTEALVKYI